MFDRLLQCVRAKEDWASRHHKRPVTVFGDSTPLRCVAPRSRRNGAYESPRDAKSTSCGTSNRRCSDARPYVAAGESEAATKPAQLYVLQSAPELRMRIVLHLVPGMSPMGDGTNRHVVPRLKRLKSLGLVLLPPLISHLETVSDHAVGGVGKWRSGNGSLV